MPESAGTLELSPADLVAIDRIVRKIPPHIYARGRGYANARQIPLIGRTGPEIRAEVEGTMTYHTRINLDSYKTTCDCPAPKPCKHIAALCRFSASVATEQVLFAESADVPRIADADYNLAIIFPAKGRVELAVSDDRGRVADLTARVLQKLKANQRSLAKAAFEVSRYADFDGQAFNHMLFSNEAALAGVDFYFGNEPRPRSFAGFLPTTYRFEELVGEEERQQRFNYRGYVNVAFAVTLETTPLPETERHQEFCLGDADGKKVFYAPASLRDGVRVGRYTLADILQHEVLKAALPEHYRHLWENRAAHGPVPLLSLYGIEKEPGKFAIEAEAAVAYMRQAEDPQEKSTEPLYAILPDVFNDEQFYEDSPFNPFAVGFSKYKNTVFSLHKSGVYLERNPDAEREVFYKYQLSRQSEIRFGKFRIAKARYLEYFEEIIPRLQKRGIHVRIHDNILGVLTRPTASLNIKPGAAIDWFEATLTVEGLSDADIAAVMRAYRKKEELTKLRDGRWISVAGTGIADILRSLSDLGIRADANGHLQPISRAALLSLAQEKAALLRTEAGAKAVVQKFRRFANASPAAINPPETFTATLRPYQRDGLAFLMKLYDASTGGILADDMGLGKTVQSVAAMACVAAQRKRARFLIVCPLAAMGVWEHEIGRFAPGLDVYRWHGTRRDMAVAEKARVVVSSFATFALDAEKFAATPFDIAFVDEAQFAKNHKSRAAAALRQIRSDCIVCLTGTPVENHVEDLWALFDVVFPGYLGTLKGFRNAYGGKTTPEQIDILRRKIRPFLLRRTKAEVLSDLPEKTETVVHVPMPPEQAKVYEAARIQAIRHLGSLSQGDSALFEMLRHLMNLRRIACHPYLEDGAADPMLSGKLQYIDEKLEDLGETAGVLIFSQFTTVLKLVALLLKKRGIDPLYLDGQTTEKRRRELVQKFQSGANKFFLISLKAGGTALTLTQADTVIHLDPWWNPAVENQASDRAHRIGQKRRVFIYKLVSEKSVEEKVLQLQEKKRELFNALMGETGGAAPAIQREDIEFILGD
jgi:superfamily II DNA or RNA helicase